MNINFFAENSSRQTFDFANFSHFDAKYSWVFELMDSFNEEIWMVCLKREREREREKRNNKGVVFDNHIRERVSVLGVEIRLTFIRHV
jgi:hypothetical protein